ncbi:phenylalanine--tRNA ligase subunit alpha [Chloroflexota bacterium]
MTDQFDELKSGALAEIAAAETAEALEAWRVQYLGKKGPVTQLLRSISGLPADEKKATGAKANRLKTLLENQYKEKLQALEESKLAAVAAGDAIDITLPGRPYPTGKRHPLSQTLDDICSVFNSMGFKIVIGPEVEWDYYNFEALNIPAEHPARDNMSTYWVDPKSSGIPRPMLLRTHTTSVTARSAERMEPPIRIIEPGKVFRYEAVDATHLPMFHQIDAFAVDKGITMADLKGTLYEFARLFFGPKRKVRFRCDFFPFVEPGVEMAIDCIACGGRGCRICGNSGWIEILGAGMTHPRVLEYAGIDHNEYSSFALGIGINRLPMLRYGIDDIRYFYSNDLRFLRQF